MNPVIQLKQTTSVFLVALLLACFGVLPKMQAAPEALPTPIPGLPNPDGCYPNFTTAEGCNALAVLGSGIGNTAIGWYSLFLADGASFNTAVGAGALALTSRTGTGITANDNTAVGTGTMLLNTAGHDNTANGTNALLFNNTASFNCAIGSFALFNNDNTGHGVANDNIAVGFGALSSNNDGADNTAVGFNALANNQASGLTAVGSGALSGNNSAIFNTAVGSGALFNNDSTRHSLANDNTAVGANALLGNTDASENTAVGSGALQNNDSTGHGMAGGNTAVGVSALLSNTDGGGNTANGGRALMNNLIGRLNTAVGFGALSSSTDDFNTAVGAGALEFNATGFRNTALGDAALQNLTSGFDNIAIGVDAGSSLHSSESRNIYIGNTGVTGESSTIRIGTHTLQTATFIEGIVGNGPFGSSVSINPATGQLGVGVSSERFKKDINPMDKSSEAIFSLRPVTFHYKNDKTNTRQWGLIAEDVEKVNPALIAVDSEGKPYTVRYEQINAMLLNEFLKEHKAFVEQQRKLEEQGATIARQQEQIEALTAGVQKISAQLELSRPTAQTVLNNQ